MKLDSQPPITLTRPDTPAKKDYSLTERPGYFRLHGGPYNLSVPACPTLFLRKQTQRACIWTTRLSFEPTSPHTEAGTVLWWNYFTYSSIGIRLSSSKHDTRVIRFRPAEGRVVEKELSTQRSGVLLVIECGEQYRFGFGEDDSPTFPCQITWVGEVSNNTMTRAPPVGASFTGMMLGLYAFGERQPCLTPADFEFAEFSDRLKV